jgi:hypothetical protein
MRFPILAICLIAVVALAVAIALFGGSRSSALTTSGACYLPTPAPSSTPIPYSPISLCNTTGQTADGLEFYVTGPMFVQPLIAVNAAGCATPSTTSSESAPDFTTTVTVSWPSACVGPQADVEIAFDCSHLDDTPRQCQPQVWLECVSWTLGGQPLGSPCPTPNCGGVPCCNGLPCPTPTPTTSTPVPTPTSPPTETPCDVCTLTPSPSLRTIPPRPTPPSDTMTASAGPPTTFVATPTPMPAALPATGGNPSRSSTRNWGVGFVGFGFAALITAAACLCARRKTSGI